MLPKQPIVHILDAGEADYGADPNNPNTQLVKYYSMYAHNIVGLRLASVKGGYDYQSEKANGIDRFGWGYVGDGYHNTTRYGEGQNETRRNGLGIVMQNWVSKSAGEDNMMILAMYDAETLNALIFCSNMSFTLCISSILGRSVFRPCQMHSLMFTLKHY